MKRRTFVRSTIAAAAAGFPAARALDALDWVSYQGQGDVEAVTGDGKQIILRSSDITQLGARLRGQLLLAKDPAYNNARRILNPDFDKRPALIVRPLGSADVVAAVSFAAERSLLVAVKCGGHSFAGHSTCDLGMMVDLSLMRGVRVDATARRAWVEGGTLLGQVDPETMAHGLVTTLGTNSNTGVGGLTLGGGFGRLARRFGLALDNVTAVEIVTADAKLRRASANENPDLFWAVRGGGGNFGIVTSFEFMLHPLQRQVVSGVIEFPFARAREVLSFYSEYSRLAPDELYVDAFVTYSRAGTGSVRLAVCYSAPQAGAERALEPIEKLGTPRRSGVTVMEYVDAQRAPDTTTSAPDDRPAGYLKAGFIRELSDDLISAIVDGLQVGPSLRAKNAWFQQSGGTIGRIAGNATAFPHRSAPLNLLAAANAVPGEDRTPRDTWLKEYWATLAPFTDGFYTNDLEPGVTAAALNANYRENYARLVSIKNKYDPGNLFRLNANVKPTV